MFYTLLERKILSYSQNRLGPNKVVFIGLLQPLLDGFKLILNEKTSSFKNNKNLF
jgi:NADH:ubiquinone oxidoreductase subunit H